MAGDRLTGRPRFAGGLPVSLWSRQAVSRCGRCFYDGGGERSSSSFAVPKGRRNAMRVAFMGAIALPPRRLGRLAGLGGPAVRPPDRCFPGRRCFSTSRLSALRLKAKETPDGRAEADRIGADTKKPSETASGPGGLGERKGLRPRSGSGRFKRPRRTWPSPAPPGSAASSEHRASWRRCTGRGKRR